MNTIDAIKNRKTIKVLASKPKKVTVTDEALIDTLIESAYWAPFHKPCDVSFRKDFHQLSAIMPWRLYVLDANNCRKLAEYLSDKDICMGKIEPMLHAADYLIQATWTPCINKNTSLPEGMAFDGSLDNMEHIAAASAAIQNLLLTATHLGYENYWSSGGCLKHEQVFNKMKINSQEILLGSLFIFPSNCHDDAELECLPSKLRDKRGPVENSYRFVHL